MFSWNSTFCGMGLLPIEVGTVSGMTVIDR
jgi:hypothetical protein